MTGDRPAVIPAAATELWESGVGRSDVRAGDLWVLSWDGRMEGLAFIAAARHGYVLAWPVTLPGETSFAPGLMLETSPLQIPVTLWPTRETGIGNHLLDRSLGRLIAPERIRTIAWALDDGEDPGLPFAKGSALDEQNTMADEDLIEHWTALCFNDGGVEQGPFLDLDKVRIAGGSPGAVAEILNIGPQQLRAVLRDGSPISSEQLATLATHLGVDGESLTGADPLADVVVDLAWPGYKHDIVMRIDETGLGEAAIRRSARSEFALAARDDGDALRETKIRHAIRRAGREV